jgi:hypothetical protein
MNCLISETSRGMLGRGYGRKPGDLKKVGAREWSAITFTESQYGRLRTLEAIVWNLAD